MMRSSLLPAHRRGAVGTLAALAMAMALAACSSGTTGTTFPPLGVTPPPAGESTAAAEAEVLGALGDVGLQATESNRVYRPQEGRGLAAAPRTVLQVQLPDDPTHGYIVLYAFASPERASAAARDQAAYVRTGPGGINYPPGTRFVLRIVGSTVVFFNWSPDVSTDARTRSIEDALLRIGSGVPVPG